MLEKLKSRKLWAAVLTAAVVAFAEQLGLDAEQVGDMIKLALGYILGQGAVDAARVFSLPPRSQA